MTATFWIALLGIGLPVYSYIGFPVLLFLLASVVQMGRDAYYLVSRSERRRRSKHVPRVTLVIAAYNEEKVIERTLTTCLALDYPRDSLEILVGSDGSADRTEEIVRQFEDRGVRLLAFRERRGKLSVLKDTVAQATGEVLVFSDANTLLQPDALRRIVRHFNNPAIGAVCGELRFYSPDGARKDEGLYWRYEQILKMLESRLDSTLGANGALYAMRRDSFPALPARLITDDFVIPLRVRSTGRRVIYDPEAVALEEAPSGLHDEFKRRVRIGAGNWQALWYCRDLLLPWKGFVSFAFWSHKVLRWFAPFCLLAGLIANAFLLSSRFWQVVLALQVAFYGAAAAGYLLSKLHLPAGPLRIVHYFVTINLALGIGMARGLLGRQKAAWQRTARQALPTEGRA